MSSTPLSALPGLFGNIDIYLFDQLLKGRIREGMTLLDAGCGDGRNIYYLMQAGIKVYGADSSSEAIAQARQLAASVAPQLSQDNFTVANLAALPYPDALFDFVVCSAVLHFATGETHYRTMVQELVRVLKPGGMLFCRFSTTIGLEGILQNVEGRFYKMSHGPVWFLANEAMLLELEQELKLHRLKPLKTVLVEQERGMTTWVVRK